MSFLCCLGSVSECCAGRYSGGKFSSCSRCELSSSDLGKTILRYCNGSKIGVGGGIGGEKVEEGASCVTGEQDIFSFSAETNNLKSVPHPPVFS
jgi:hypothetical protein